MRRACVALVRVECACSRASRVREPCTVHWDKYAARGAVLGAVRPCARREALCLCAALSGAGKITATPQPHLNHEPTALARAQLAHPRTHPPVARQGRRATGQAQRQAANGCLAVPWGGGRGRGALLSEAHWGSTGQRYQDRCAGRREGPPPPAHRLQEGRRLHLREVSQAAERKKRARQSSAALLFLPLRAQD